MAFAVAGADAVAGSTTTSAEHWVDAAKTPVAAGAPLMVVGIARTASAELEAALAETRPCGAGRPRDAAVHEPLVAAFYRKVADAASDSAVRTTAAAKSNACIANGSREIAIGKGEFAIRVVEKSAPSGNKSPMTVDKSRAELR